MRSEAKPDTLRRLARRCGIETEYYDLSGTLVCASDRSLQAALKAYDDSFESSDPKALMRLINEQSAYGIPPVVVAWNGKAPPMAIKSETKGGVKVHLIYESGECITMTGDRWISPRKGGGILLNLPNHLPDGYHNLKLIIDDAEFKVLLIAAPRKCYKDEQSPRRKWGLFAPLYSLRSDNDWGAGAYPDGHEFVKWMAGLGAAFWGILPTHASINDETGRSSPYSPHSRLFWSEFFIDPVIIPEFRISSQAQNLVGSIQFQKEIKALQTEPMVDYARLTTLKRQTLEILAREFLQFGKPSRRRLFRDYLIRIPEVIDYANYRALQEEVSPNWREWPDAIMQGEWTPRGRFAEFRNYYLYAQWNADQQMDDLANRAKQEGAPLYLDLPVGVHPDGYDAWRYQHLFVWGASVGAPPDPLGPDGQDWGFAPLHPEVLRRDQYHYFRKMVQFQMSRAGLLRIDHIMGFHRLFWIPSGMSGKDGVYVRYPAEELFAVLSLESHRHKCAVIGEDLGTVPPEVHVAMKNHNVRGMFILPFEAGKNALSDLRPPTPDSIAALNTHDMAPFAGYVTGDDVKERFELGFTDDAFRDKLLEERVCFVRSLQKKLEVDGFWPEQDSDNPRTIVVAANRYLAASNAELMMVNVEDLWCETKPQNIPGSTYPVPNWRRKLAKSISEIKNDSFVNSFLKEIHQYRLSGGSIMSPRKKTESGVVKAAGKRAKKPVIAAPASAIGGSLPLFWMTGDDNYLFNEGSHLCLFEKLGAHPCEYEEEKGTHFAVWAPDAEAVYVMGEFNGWNRNSHPLFANGQSGVWEAFIPGVTETAIYKYFIKSRFDKLTAEKADPMAFHAETPPKTGSIVWDIAYQWKDGDWMSRRGARNQRSSPISIYEMHLGSWRRKVEDNGRILSYRELAEILPAYIKQLGFTHVEFLPVMEHPFTGSWGYQVTGFFAPTSRYGTPQDLMFLIDCLHQEGIGVILDWVPSHFPTDGYGLGYFDGTHLYEHADNRQGFHPDWGSLIFNYGRNEVRSFLYSSAMFWLDKFHADGLRLDAVASMLYLDYSRKAGEWIPNQYGGRENLDAISFLRRLNEEVYRRFPDVQMIAEESTAWPMVSRPTYLGGLGFGFKWDMGWMHDLLDYIAKDPVHRRFHHNSLTFRALYAWHENFILPLSHDEVVHGKGSLLSRMPGDIWRKFANVRLLFTSQFTQPGKKLLFMGSEIGQWAEWDHDRSLDWHLLEYQNHQGLQRLVVDLNRLYCEQPALHELDCEPEGFEWVDCNDSDASTISFLRWNKDHSECILIVLNYTPVTRFDYRVGVPKGGTWRELFNSDSEHYGGSGKGNLGEVYSTGQSFHSRPDSLLITLPPLGGVILKG